VALLLVVLGVADGSSPEAVLLLEDVPLPDVPLPDVLGAADDPPLEAVPLPDVPLPDVLGAAEDPPPDVAPLPECAAPPEAWVLEPWALVGFGEGPALEDAPLLEAAPLLVEAVPPVAVLGAAEDCPPAPAPVLSAFAGPSESLLAEEEPDPSPVSA
jgi:hypothetical protein